MNQNYFFFFKEAILKKKEKPETPISIFYLELANFAILLFSSSYYY